MSKKIRPWHKVIKEKENIEITRGVAIDKSVYDIKENRIHTLVIKGLLTYCLTMGGAGVFLSALGIEYSELIVNIVALASALICSLLYYNSLTENVGYLVYFGLFALGAYSFRDYINSGFYSIVNDVMERASIYLDMEGLQHYNERIDDRYTAITVTMVFFIMLISILINNYISRRARYLVTAVIVLFFSIIPFYFENEPDTFYTVLLLGGFVMAYFLRSGRHYRLYRRSSVFYHDRNGLSYGIDHKSLRQVMLIGFVFVFLFVNIAGMFVPKDGYDAQGNNKYKKATMETVTNLFTLGIQGIFNYYANRGGLSTGRLGGVSSIKLDYETDITVEYTPYSYETLYLKQFVGNVYNPYLNSWSMKLDFRTPEGENHETVELLKKAYERGSKYSAKAKLRVTNVEATSGIYLPYYSDDADNMVYYNTTAEYEYYPDLYLYTTEFYLYGMADTSKSKVDPDCRRIPVENYDVIAEFVRENNIGGDNPEEIIDNVITYFQENVPYTIRPGATPRSKDFVNYFLTKNKKGYCAHFASATALILRYFDIPTRYCEGYAISYDQATHYGELVKGAKYSDYYDGYNVLGETALISVDATDADAHAWVEAYIDGKGWVVVEATPSGDEEELLDFWEQFSNSDGSDDDEEVAEEEDDGFRFRINDSLMKKATVIVIVVLAVILLVFMVIFFRPTIVYIFRYARAGRNDRLILKYMRYIKKQKRKDSEFRDKMNYETQLEYLRKSGKMTCTDEEAERLIDILNTAGFSNKMLSEEDVTFAEKVLYH